MSREFRITILAMLIAILLSVTGYFIYQLGTRRVVVGTSDVGKRCQYDAQCQNGHWCQYTEKRDQNGFGVGECADNEYLRRRGNVPYCPLAGNHPIRFPVECY